MKGLSQPLRTDEAVSWAGQQHQGDCFRHDKVNHCLRTRRTSHSLLDFWRPVEVMPAVKLAMTWNLAAHPLTVRRVTESMRAESKYEDWTFRRGEYDLERVDNAKRPHK